jgi:hypothetical protein
MNSGQTFLEGQIRSEISRCGNWVEVDEKALLALAKATNKSLSAHVSKHVFFLSYASRDRRQAKKALNRIVKSGLAMKHPTGGGMTYQLTRRGLTLVWEFEQDLIAIGTPGQYYGKHRRR